MQTDNPQTEVWTAVATTEGTSATHCLGYINQAYKGRLDFIRLQSSLRFYSRDFSRRVFLVTSLCFD